MIKKKFKLTSSDLKNFFTKKNYYKIKGKNFLILYQKNNLNYPRFTVICRKKFFKKSVLRNKIKRKIYEMIRQNIFAKIKHTNYDFIIIPILKQDKSIDINFLKLLKSSIIKLSLNND